LGALSRIISKNNLVTLNFLKGGGSSPNIERPKSSAIANQASNERPKSSSLVKPTNNYQPKYPDIYEGLFDIFNWHFVFYFEKSNPLFIVFTF